MLLLLFQAGSNRFGINAENILEVAPSVTMHRPPGAPLHIAGVMDYRGTPVPVVDMSAICSGNPSKPFLSTRIILTHYQVPGGKRRVLGLLAEKVTETLPCEKNDFVASGISLPDSPFLGEIKLSETEPIQLINPETILPEAIRETLFCDER